MIEEYTYVGNINNWLDLKEKLQEILNKCDNRYKFERFLTTLWISITPNLDEVQERRKELNLRLLTKKELKEYERIFKE